MKNILPLMNLFHSNGEKEIWKLGTDNNVSVKNKQKIDQILLILLAESSLDG